LSSCSYNNERKDNKEHESIEATAQANNGADSTEQKEQKEQESLSKVDLWMIGRIDDYVNIGYSGRVSDNSTKKVMVYMRFKKDVQSKCRIKAYTAEELELGDATVIITGQCNEASYIDFVFDKRTPLSLAKYYSIELEI
jgi:hypothetical protein